MNLFIHVNINNNKQLSRSKKPYSTLNQTFIHKKNKTSRGRVSARFFFANPIADGFIVIVNITLLLSLEIGNNMKIPKPIPGLLIYDFIWKAEINTEYLIVKLNKNDTRKH